MYRDFGTIISKHVGAFGYDVVRTYCGHGVGELFHCAPNIPHYNGTLCHDWFVSCTFSPFAMDLNLLLSFMLLL
jgi:methionine aminopeptidase